MIALFIPSESASGGGNTQVAAKWAEMANRDDEPNVTDCRLGGRCSRMAMEYHLRELCRRIGPPNGERWHNFAIRLMKAGTLTMDQYRHVRRIMRLAAKSVHGKPFCKFRAKLLLEMVTEIVES